MEIALDNGADDFVALDDAFEIYTTPADFSPLREALEAQNYEFIEAAVEMIPQTTVEMKTEEELEKVIKIIDLFDDNDDVREVFHNALIDGDEDE